MNTQTEPLFDTITEAAISELVERFYAAVRRDPDLGPVFEAAIAEQKWPAHLATMKRFWSSVMLTSGRYSGNPVAVHRAVNGLERPLFARWLALFETTVAQVFAREPAGRVVEKAHRIAGSLQLAVFHRLGAAPDGLPPRVASAA